LPLIISLIFGGFFVNLGSLPAVAEIFPYLSFVKWVFQALAINEFTDVNFKCDITPATLCTTNGKEILERFTFNETLGESVFGLAMLFVGFTVIAFIALDGNYTTYTEQGFVGKKYITDAETKK